MSYNFLDYEKSSTYLQTRLSGFAPEVLLVLGSGLGFLGDIVENPISVPYDEIPNFCKATAPGHSGRLIFGRLAGKNVCVMQGRFHYYEGYGYDQITFPIRLAKLLGADKMIITNAAGGLGEGLAPGSIMLITDHMKFFDASPLRGQNLPEFGVRFPDMTYCYNRDYQTIAQAQADKLSIKLGKGVYLYWPGPQFETPAEIIASKTLGASAVGMSTVPEVIVARHMKMEVLGFSFITNFAAGIIDKPISEEEVLTEAEHGKENFKRLVLACLGEM